LDIKSKIGPKPALKKRDAKAQSKGLHVKFNDKPEIHTFY